MCVVQETTQCTGIDLNRATWIVQEWQWNFEHTAPTRSSDRVCKQCTRCDDGYYATGGCTGVSDTVCKRCAACIPLSEGIEYQSARCTVMRNTVCSDIEPCQADEWQAQDPTEVSQRLCIPIRKCTYCADPYAIEEEDSNNGYGGQDDDGYGRRRRGSDDDYYDDNDGAKDGSLSGSGSGSGDIGSGSGSDGSWERKIVCKYESEPPTRFSNRKCKKIKTVCEDSDYVAVAASNTSNTVCERAHECGLGEEEDIAPGVEQDRVCRPCDGILEYQDEIALTECKQVTVCGWDQYESRSPTATRDRGCSAATMCNAAQYAVSPLTPTADRVCTKVTDCQYDVEYEASAPTETSDRKCAPLTVCNSQQWESAEPSQTGNRECSEHTMQRCPAGQFQNKAGDRTSDRTCMPYTLCKPDLEFMSVAGGPEQDYTCNTITNCAENTFEVREPTAQSGRVCAKITVCEPGSYIQTNRTRTADRRCVKCNERTQWQDQANQLSCNMFRTCGADEYADVRTGSLTSDRACRKLTPLYENFYISTQATATSDQQVKRCSFCTRDQYEHVGCVNGTSRKCKSIARPCRIMDNNYEQTAPTKTSNRVCSKVTECMDNEWHKPRTSALSDVECRPITPCPAGSSAEVAASPTNDNTCTPCTVGVSFSSSDNTARCTKCTVCPRGQGYTANCSTTADGICSDCRPGTYATLQVENTGTIANANAQACQPCPAETFSAIWRMETCTAWAKCRPGTEVAREPTQTSDRTCVGCTAGTYRAAGMRVSAGCVPHTVCNASTGGVDERGTAVSDTMCIDKPATLAPTVSTSSLVNITTLMGGTNDDNGGAAGSKDGVGGSDDSPVLYVVIALVVVLVGMLGVMECQKRKETKTSRDLTAKGTP